MYEGEEVNTIDLLDENSTTEGNGVKIIVPVSWYDRQNFYNKIKEQLCYFENVYFDVNVGGSVIDNDFKITRYADFQLSELNNDDQMHICLDNIYYPLDFKKLGIDAINVPIGLRFNLSDGIFPIPNREAVRMGSEAKVIILDKIKKVASEIVTMYNKTIQDTDDIKTIVQYYRNNNRLLDVGHKKGIEISSLAKYSNVKVVEPRLNGITLLNLRTLFSNDEFLNEYNIKYYLSHGRMRENKYDNPLHLYEVTENNSIIYKFADRVGGNKKEYVKSVLPTGYRSAHFVKKSRTRRLFPQANQSISCYYTMLNLQKYARSQWRERIKECQSIIEKITKGFIDLDAIDVPKDWLDARKKQRVYKSGRTGHQKLTGEMSCKRAEALERYVDGKNCKFTPFSIDLGKLPQQSKFYIYTSHEESMKLDPLFLICMRMQKISLITFSDRELKKINEAEIHNLISYENFMKGNTKPFKRLVTAYLIYKLDRDFRSTFGKRSELKGVSIDLSVKLENLYSYMRQHYNNGSEDVYDSMVGVAEKYSLYDGSIYPLYLEIKEMLEKFPFIETLCSVFPYSRSEKMLDVIADQFKYHKHKVNIDRYETKNEEKEEEIINN